jgi:heptosyltransferase-2
MQSERDVGLRIVVLRPGALGDSLLAFPALALVRRRWPGAHLTLIARGDVLSLARASGLADETVPYEISEWAALFGEGPPEGSIARAVFADAEAVVAWLPDSDGCVARNLADLGVRRICVAPGRSPEGMHSHAALWLARTLVPLDITPPRQVSELAMLVPPPRWSAEEGASAAALWASLGLPEEPQRVVALHPGSGGAVKRWPPAAFAQLAARLASIGYAPLLIAGPQDVEIADAVLAALPMGMAPVPVARALAVGGLAALLARCGAFAGNDSGVAHLAGLLGLAVLVFFGPTDPAMWAPLGAHVRTVRAPNGALARLGVETVWEAMRQTLARDAGDV